jgi:hypothetical protein
MFVAVGVIVVFVLMLLALGVWMLAPTLRTFRRPGFEPASGDDVSVLRAQASGTVVDGGGH